MPLASVGRSYSAYIKEKYQNWHKVNVVNGLFILLNGHLFFANVCKMEQKYKKIKCTC